MNTGPWGIFGTSCQWQCEQWMARSASTWRCWGAGEAGGGAVCMEGAVGSEGAGVRLWCSLPPSLSPPSLKVRVQAPWSLERLHILHDTAMTKGARAGARGSLCELQLCAYSAPARKKIRSRSSGVPLVRPQLSRSSVSVPSGADSGPGHRGIARPDFPRNAPLRVLILHPGRSLIILISGVVPGIDPHCLNL